MAHGIFWSCEKCGGRALTIELLRRTFSRSVINPLWLHALENEGAPGRPCPLCSRPFLTIALTSSTPEPIALDVCKSCRLVWFDRGEVENLSTDPRPTSPSALTSEQVQVLAKAKADALAETVRSADHAEAWKQIGRFLDAPVPGWWGLL